MQQRRMYKNKNNVFDVREREFVYVCKCEWVFEYVVLSLSSAHINMPSLNIFQLIGHKNFTRTFLFILPAFLFVFDTNEERNSSTITTTKTVFSTWRNEVVLWSHEFAKIFIQKQKAWLIQRIQQHYRDLYTWMKR